MGRQPVSMTLIASTPVSLRTRSMAAEVLVAGRRYDLVRRRESLKDLLRGEALASWQ